MTKAHDANAYATTSVGLVAAILRSRPSARDVNTALADVDTLDTDEHDLFVTLLRPRPRLEALSGWLRVPANLALVAITVFLVSASVTVPVDRKGDGSEYILTTESLYYDHDLIVSNTVDVFRHLEMRPAWMDTPAGLTRVKGRDGHERYGLHSFYYPLVCVPFYALFGYHGFYILNALLVAATIASVYAHFARTHSRGLALGFAAVGVLSSAVWSYVFWTQTETFYTALIALYLYSLYAGRPLRAAIFIGVAAGAQFPLALLAAPLLIEPIARRDLRQAAAIVGVVAACVGPQLYYDVHFLGTIAPMARVGLASVHYLSIAMLGRFLFDPAMGLVWFYPIVAYCLVRWRPTIRSASLLVTTLLVLAIMTSVYNVYSHQVGVRYAAYALPVLLFSVGTISLEGWASKIAAVFAVVVGAGLALNPLDNSRDMDIRHKTFLPYRIASALGVESENPEVFRASSDVLTDDRVYTRDVTLDRWTWGGDRAKFMILRAHAGTLDLELRSYPGASQQHVEIRTMSGQKIDTWLPPREVTRVSVTLGLDDVRHYSRWGSDYAYVTLWATPWSPAITLEGHAPEADDIRRLGVRVEGVALDGESLFAR